jgi:hypothetical protein
MFWLGTGQEGSHGSADVVLEGVGILLAPFLRDLLTYDLEAVKEALGIFTTASTTANAISKQRRHWN